MLFDQTGFVEAYILDATNLFLSLSLPLVDIKIRFLPLKSLQDGLVLGIDAVKLFLTNIPIEGGWHGSMSPARVFVSKG